MNIRPLIALNILLALSNLTNGQINHWYQCKYISKNNTIDKLFEKNLLFEKVENGFIVSIDKDKTEIFTENGIVDLYLTNERLFKLNNDKKIMLFKGETINRSKYIMKFLEPNLNQKSLFDTSLIYEIDNRAEHLGLVKIPINSSNFKTDTYKRSLKIDSLHNGILKDLNKVEKIKNGYIIISNDKNIKINQNTYQIRLIRANTKVRHYVIEEFGGQLLLKDINSKATEVTIVYLNGKIDKYYCSN